jgi:hypothetical protein
MEMKTTAKTKSPSEFQEPDWEFLDYAARLEEQWKQTLPHYTDKELLAIFPEAKIIIPLKIREWMQEQKKVIEVIKAKLRVVYKKSAKENQWFWKEVVKQLDGHKLMEINKHLTRLYRQRAIAENRKPKGNRLSEEQIQQALAVPLVDIAMRSIKLRRAGRTFMGLCPFHNERRPSFHIYPQKNNFYCYGCNKGGNVINFVRETQGLSFREAINYLNGN